MKRFQITEEEYKGIKEAERQTRDKNVSRRLRVIMMRYEGRTTDEAAKATGMSRVNVSLICKRYKEQGLEELIRNNWRPFLPGTASVRYDLYECIPGGVIKSLS